MKPIVLHLTPEDAHNNLVLIDLALKHPDGGIKVMKAAIAITDKINAAVAESQKPDEPDKTSHGQEGAN